MAASVTAPPSALNSSPAMWSPNGPLVALIACSSALGGVVVGAGAVASAFAGREVSMAGAEGVVAVVVVASLMADAVAVECEGSRSTAWASATFAGVATIGASPGFGAEGASDVPPKRLRVSPPIEKA